MYDKNALLTKKPESKMLGIFLNDEIKLTEQKRKLFNRTVVDFLVELGENKSWKRQ